MNNPQIKLFIQWREDYVGSYTGFGFGVYKGPEALNPNGWV